MTIFKLLVGDITDENIHPLLECINDSNQQTKFVIGITSEGGDSYSGRFLLNVLNDPSNVKRITLVCVEKCYSIAFDIFYKFKGKKQIMLGSSGMLHYDSTSLQICHKDLIKHDPELPCSLEQLKVLRDETIKSTLEFAKDYEISELQRGSDIYFTYSRMLEIFKDIEVV